MSAVALRRWKRRGGVKDGDEVENQRGTEIIRVRSLPRPAIETLCGYFSYFRRLFASCTKMLITSQNPPAAAARKHSIANPG